MSRLPKNSCHHGKPGGPGAVGFIAASRGAPLFVAVFLPLVMAVL